MLQKVLAGFFCAIASIPAFACSCTPPQPVEYLRSAGIVFRGTVVQVGDRAPLSAEPTSAAAHLRPSIKVARFRIEALFKGKAGQEIEIAYAQRNGSNCGWAVKEGENVTVFARKAGGAYITDSCMFFYETLAREGDDRYVNALREYMDERDRYQKALDRGVSKEATLRAQGAFFQKYNDLDQAETTYTAILAARPYDVPALARRGDVRYALQSYEAALADYNAALSLNRHHGQAGRGRTLSLIKLARINEIGEHARDFSGLSVTSAEGLAFADMDLRGAQFREARLSKADFSRADLRKSNFSGSSLHTVTFLQARLAGSRFDKLKGAYQVQFDETDLNGASFRQANLFGSSFNGADLRHADFRKAILERVTLERTKLDKANFGGASLLEAGLGGTIWQGQDLSKADLRGANLSGAKLTAVNLRGAKIGSLSSSFAPTDLRGADLSSADLRDVTWTHTLFDCRTKFPTHVKVSELPFQPAWDDCVGEPPRTTFRNPNIQRGP